MTPVWNAKTKPAGLFRILSSVDEHTICQDVRSKNVSIRKVTATFRANASHGAVYIRVIHDGEYAYKTKFKMLFSKSVILRSIFAGPWIMPIGKMCGIELFLLVKSVSILMAQMDLKTIGGIYAVRRRHTFVGIQEEVALCFCVPYHLKVKRLCASL